MKKFAKHWGHFDRWVTVKFKRVFKQSMGDQQFKTLKLYENYNNLPSYTIKPVQCGKIIVKIDILPSEKPTGSA